MSINTRFIFMFGVLPVVIVVLFWFAFIKVANNNTGKNAEISITPSAEDIEINELVVQQAYPVDTTITGKSEFINKQPNSYSKSAEKGGSSESASLPIKNQDSQQIINAYMSAWGGNNSQQLDELWATISQCEECLLIIQELMMNQAMPKGMLLELTYRTIKLGNEVIMPIFDYLLQPSVDRNTRLVVTQQMIRDGRPMYIAKILEIMQQAYMDGNLAYAVRNIWMISNLKNSQGIEAVLDVITMKTAAPEDFIAHTKKVAINTLLVNQKDADITDALVDYYLNANDEARNNLRDMMEKSNKGLVVLAVGAYDNGIVDDFNNYAQSLVNLNGMQAVDGVMELQSALDYQTEYFIDLIRQIAVKNLNKETLQRLQEHLQNPKADMQIKIVAAEGLISVKDQSQRAKYILENAINSVGYDNAEIVSYISARL